MTFRAHITHGRPGLNPAYLWTLPFEITSPALSNRDASTMVGVGRWRCVPPPTGIGEAMQDEGPRREMPTLLR